jgi:hypothetical protein
MNTTKNYYVVKIDGGSFSNIEQIKSPDGNMKTIQTLEEAREAVNRFCDPSILNKDFDVKNYGKYWEAYRNKCNIFKCELKEIQINK